MLSIMVKAIIITSMIGNIKKYGVYGKNDSNFCEEGNYIRINIKEFR